MKIMDSQWTLFMSQEQCRFPMNIVDVWNILRHQICSFEGSRPGPLEFQNNFGVRFFFSSKSILFLMTFASRGRSVCRGTLGSPAARYLLRFAWYPSLPGGSLRQFAIALSQPEGCLRRSAIPFGRPDGCLRRFVKTNPHFDGWS